MACQSCTNHACHLPVAGQNYANISCRDCGVNTKLIGDYYMVHDEVWLSVGMDLYDGMLCIQCLESRLGRELTPADFTDAPVNHFDVVVVRSAILMNRLTGRENLL